MDEFELIERFLVPLTESGRDQRKRDFPSDKLFDQLRTREDCALLHFDQDVVALSSDTLVAGVHFDESISIETIASRAIATAVSDLAAANAKPDACLLNLVLPKAFAGDERSLLALHKGLDKACARYGLSIVGGDTTKGENQVSSSLPSVISVTCLGRVEGSENQLRSLGRGLAQADACLYCAPAGESLGLASLRLAEGFSELADIDQILIEEAFACPALPFELAKLAAASGARAAMDVSDGLLADVQKFAKCSGLGVELFLDQVPVSRTYYRLAARLGLSQEEAAIRALSFGDDYALLFALPADCLSPDLHRRLLQSKAKLIGRFFAAPTQDQDKRSLVKDERFMITCSNSDQVVVSLGDEADVPVGEFNNSDGKKVSKEPGERGFKTPRKECSKMGNSSPGSLEDGQALWHTRPSSVVKLEAWLAENRAGYIHF